MNNCFFFQAFTQQRGTWEEKKGKNIKTSNENGWDKTIQR